MIKTLLLDEKVVVKTFERVLDPSYITPELDFYDRVRCVLKKVVIETAINQGFSFSVDQSIKSIDRKKSTMKSLYPIKYKDRYNTYMIDAKHCLTYGFDRYSAKALNWYNKEAASYPSLQTLISTPNVFIGNIVFVLNDVDYEELVIKLEGPLRAVGYSYDISPRKRKPNFCLTGIYFDNFYLRNNYKSYIKNCICDVNNLAELPIDYPMVFICNTCGKFYVCRCFENYFEREQLDLNFKFRDNICHLCTGRVPAHIFGSSMYYSKFGQHFLPYLQLYKKMYPNEASENILRERLGYPKVGEQWISETVLFKMVKSIFPDFEVIHHAKPKWLKGLELDVYVPHKHLAFEYQGKQHYEPVKYFGGEKAFKDLQLRDQSKRKLCIENNITLIEISYKEEFTEEIIRNKINDALKMEVQSL